MINYHENLSLENLFYINEKGLVCLEEFRDIPKYEGVYQVSNLGRVKSLKRYVKHYSGGLMIKNEIILRQYVNDRGYCSVALHKYKKQKTISTHQLVAIVFYGHVPCGYELVIDHKNHVKHINILDNLRLITQRQNANKKHIKSSSSYVGVIFNKQSKKFVASIRVKQKLIHLGYFSNEIEASEYYQNALKSIENGTEIVIKKPVFSSKYKGVSWDKKDNVWVCYIKINGTRIYLGGFVCEKTASLHYEKAFENNLLFDGDKLKFRNLVKSLL